MRTNYRHKRSSVKEGGSHWLSFSDMMSVLVLIFIFVVFSMLSTLAQEEDALEQMEIEYSTKIQALNLSLAETESKLTKAQAENLQIVVLMDDLNSANAALADARAQLNEALAEAQNQRVVITNLNAQLADYNMLLSQVSEANAQVLTLTNENRALTAQNATLLNENADLTGKNSILLRDLADARTAVRSKDDQLSEYQQLLATRQGELEQMIGVKAEIIEQLSRELSVRNISVQVDSQTGAITLPSGMLFDVGKNELSDVGKAYLDEFLPIYLNVLMSDRFIGYVAEIIIEGHTDSTGRAGSDAYLYNLELSQQRALSVSDYVLSANYMQSTLRLNANEQTALRKLITASGRSYSALVLSGGVEDKEASRRVEIKFRLSDEETIAKMEALLRLMEAN